MSPDFIRRIRLPAYLVAAFLSLGSVVEILVSAWPLRVHDLNWRLSALNSAAGATGTELLALLVLLAVAQLSASAGGLWAGFWGALLVAIAYLGGAATFGLDSLQLRGRIPAAELHRFDVAVIWTLLRFGIVEVACFAFAACALAAARSLKREMARDSSNRIIVGTSSLETARSAAVAGRRG